MVSFRRSRRSVAHGATGSVVREPRAGIAESTGRAEVHGSTTIPQLVVGTPSPTVEPVVTGSAYRTLPFRPDVVIDGWSTELMTVRGASLRGHLHRYNGAPRQDDFAVHHVPGGRIVVVVADGVSGATQSHLGASIATRQAAEWLCARAEAAAEIDWAAMFKSAAWALAERAQTLLNLAGPDPVSAEELLATTLVCGVVEPMGSGALRAHLAGVGDSNAWLLSARSQRFTELLGGKAMNDGGISSSEVSGLPRVPASVTPVVVDVGPGDALLFGTDGVGDPLGSGDGGVGDLLRTVLLRATPPSLLEFAHAVDFSRETFDDDRTLVAVWARGLR